MVIVYLKVLLIFRRSYFRFWPFFDPKNSKNRRSHLRFFVDAHILTLGRFGIKKAAVDRQNLAYNGSRKGSVRLLGLQLIYDDR